MSYLSKFQDNSTTISSVLIFFHSPFKGIISLFMVLISLGVASSANAQFIALDSNRTTGNQTNHSGSLGMDFDVNSPISITHLGAYDSNQDGFSNNITVRIFDRTTQSQVTGLSATINSSDVLNGHSRYEDITDIELGIGQYSIVASGFGSSDPNGNAVDGNPAPTINNGSGLITFVGVARYSSNTLYPTLLDGGPANRYDAGTFQFTASQTSSPTTTLSVENDIGSAIIATPISVDTTHDTVPTANTIVTDTDDEISLVDEDNTLVTIKPNSLVTQHSKKVVGDTQTKKTTLLRGSVAFKVPGAAREYVVVTPLGRFVVTSQSANKRDDSTTDFNVNYSQENFNGNLSISVTSGSVDFYDQNNTKHTLTVGAKQTVTSTVHQSSWVLPIDGDYIYGGRENTLSWLVYPDAAGYILEYNFPSPNFSEDNPNTPEFVNKSIFFYPSQYKIWQDLVIVPLIIPDLPGSVVEARIFAIDASNNVISESLASDKGTYTFK